MQQCSDFLTLQSNSSHELVYIYLGTGPIRTKHRKDTSPYGSERLSISNAPGGSSSHLSPPDTSGAWRRVRSDPFLATHSRSNSGSSTGVSPAGSVTDAPTAVQDSNGGISPLHGASPTMQRRGTGITCLNVSACLEVFFLQINEYLRDSSIFSLIRPKTQRLIVS